MKAPPLSRTARTRPNSVLFLVFIFPRTTPAEALLSKAAHPTSAPCLDGLAGAVKTVLVTPRHDFSMRTLTDEDVAAIAAAVAKEVAALMPSQKRIEPDGLYSIEEAAALIPGTSVRTIRRRLRCRWIVGARGGSRAPWIIRGSELLKLGGRTDLTR